MPVSRGASWLWARGQSSARSVDATFQKPACLGGTLCSTIVRKPTGLLDLDSSKRVLFSELDGLIKHHLEDSVDEIRGWSRVKGRG